MNNTRDVELIKIAKAQLIRDLHLFKSSHECGYDIIKFDDIEKAIPKVFLEHFYECSRGSTCVPEGYYFHDVVKFINRL